ncbi:ameloblastin [Tiliqua scincoides]|uniref:ameloblastin n=1 Tax=Tiliqua scincoides TaxID=71010 RepID=UPI00346317F5
MKRWILVSCLLGICSAVPIPQFPGIPGMGSLNLQTMRQLSGSNMPNVLSQYAQPYSVANPFHSVWMHNFLPPQSSFYWMSRRPREHETQRYEYTLPVHPPPLPSQQPPFIPQQPGMQDQNPYQFINLVPTKQVQLQQHDGQPPFQQPFPFPLPEGNQPTIQQQPLSDKQKQQLGAQENTGTLGKIFPGLQGTQQDPVQQPQQRSIYPNLYFMPYMANQGGAPGRLGIVSSEEMQGGGLGASPYQAMGPNLFPMGSGFGNMPPKTLGQPGDFTVEDDQLGITEQPEVQGGANPGTGNNVVPLDGTLGGAFPNANSHLQNPASQSKGLSGVPQGTVTPLATQGFPDSFPYGADAPMPLDPTMFPYSTNVGNGGGQPQVVPDGWHFQEP